MRHLDLRIDHNDLKKNAKNCSSAARWRRGDGLRNQEGNCAFRFALFVLSDSVYSVAKWRIILCKLRNPRLSVA